MYEYKHDLRRQDPEHNLGVRLVWAMIQPKPREILHSKKKQQQKTHKYGNQNYKIQCHHYILV